MGASVQDYGPGKPWQTQGGQERPSNLAVKVQKMITEDDPEAYLSSFERTAQAVNWPESQWVAVLIPCLVGPAQQAVHTLPDMKVTDYKRVRVAILLTFSPETYRRQL